MDQNPSNTQSLSYKRDFLQKYSSIPKIIKSNVSCYAISYEWWSNFECLIDIAQMEADMPMGNPGPINNLPILNLEKIYKELINLKGEGSYPGCPDAIVLSEMSDWDNMRLKQNIKYGKDFVIVSAYLWNFLKERFGGGPKIELLPENKPNILKHSSNVITSNEETLFETNMIINLDMIKIYVTSGHDFTSLKAKYISPTITLQTLLSCLCKDYSFSPHNATIYQKTQDHGSIELSNKNATLKELGIHEGSFLTLSRQMNPFFGFPSVSRNQESIEREDMDSNRANEDEERPLRQQFSQDSDFGGNYSTNSRDSTDSAKLSTGSTNHHLNPLDFSEYMLGDDVSGINNTYNRGDIEMKEFGGGHNSEKCNNIEFKEQTHPQLEVFLQRSKQSLEKGKVKLQFKTLQEIKINLINIQREWNLWTNNNTQKKC